MEAAEETAESAMPRKDGLELTAVAVEHASPPAQSREYSAKEARAPQLRLGGEGTRGRPCPLECPLTRGRST